MVTNLKQSIHAHKNGAADQDKTEAEVKAFTAKTKDKVTAAVKARTESFGLLASAAAHSFYLGIVHGRWEQANRLFNELSNSKAGRIDADALRQQFAFRVNDKYAVDGQHDTDASGNEISAWVKRPTTMIVYLANPEDKISHFSLAKAGKEDTPANNAKRELISKYREKVRAAGVEDLEAIEWLTRDRVINKPAPYDITKFQGQLVRLLKEAAKATGDAESGVTVAMIESIMRDTNMTKAMKVDIRDAYSADPTEKPKAEQKEGEKSEIPVNHPSQTTQAAA